MLYLILTSLLFLLFKCAKMETNMTHFSATIPNNPASSLVHFNSKAHRSRYRRKDQNNVTFSSFQQIPFAIQLYKSKKENESRLQVFSDHWIRIILFQQTMGTMEALLHPIRMEDQQRTTEDMTSKAKFSANTHLQNLGGEIW